MAGAPLAYAKKTWSGQARRRELLARHGIVLPDMLGPAGQAPPDDVLDAAAVAWSAPPASPLPDRGGPAGRPPPDVLRDAGGGAWSAQGRGTKTPAISPDPPQEYDGSRIAIWY